MEEENSHRRRRWIGCPIEEAYLGEDRKEDKKTRKIAQSKDRSKFKKTDRDKYSKSLKDDQEAKLSSQDWLEGRVLSIMPQGIIVEYENILYTCILKGLLKKEKTEAKNLVAVGDFVLFEKTSDNEGIIGRIQPRKTFLSRADNLSRRKEQLIAVNIDQVIITVAVVNPPLKCPIIDRYIIATQKGGMQPIIVINKIDLLDNPNNNIDDFIIEQERINYEEAIKAYQAADVILIPVSAETGQGIDLLKNQMKDKASVFSGPSGVGKSSLINQMTGLNLRVGEIVEKTKKGAHTTTTTQLIPLEFGGWCIDTPGIKSFGVWKLDKEEVQAYFPEIFEIGINCKFTDCSHTHEENCAVIKAVESGDLSVTRYGSYQALMESVQSEHVRR
ncbi:MAG: ribosome small subunit-dependent GTPase A [Parachlamydiaceae bacterium]|nr:ribosome small subunit-dependent GTPase A [Parachlamydiaceae bacterium]